jgi:hypothetical protein
MSLTCTYHCSPCGRHFHSLEAFDMHHERDADGWPRCLDPVDLLDRDGRVHLVELGRGECRMYQPGRPIERDVVIWTSARSVGRAAARFTDSAESLAQATGGEKT